MKLRVFILGCIIFFISIILTGCTANINITSDTNKTEDKVSSDEEFETEECFEITDEEDCFEEEKYQSVYIDLGDKYYNIIYGLDENKNATWTYETAISEIDKYATSINQYKDELIYVIDNGILLALDMESGEVLWRLENEELVNVDCLVRKNGIIDCVYGEKSKLFMSVDTAGNVLKKIDLSEYNTEENEIFWFDYFQENEVVITTSNAEDFRDDMKIKIDLNTYEVSFEKYEYNEVTEDLLAGKIISNECYESYIFNNDGTVVIQRDDIYEKFCLIRLNGTWKLEDGMLKIHVNEAVVAYNATVDTNENGDNILVDYQEKVVPANFERDGVIYYCPNYEGEPKIYLDGSFLKYIEAVV